jgi:hypothetical protein
VRREFAREGLGYVLRIPALTTELAVDRLHAGRDGLQSYLTVTCGLPGTKSADGHIHGAKFNVSSSTSRKSVASLLTQRAGVPEIDWFDLLEDLCRRVEASERTGDPVEKVGALPIPVGESYRLDPVLPIGQVTILYGEGGTGKSTMAAAIGVSVQEGVALIEGWAPRQAPVLYLDWEAGTASLNRRVRGVAMGAHIPRVVQIDYLNCRRRGPLYGFAEDVAKMVDREGYGLVVADSVQMASGTSSEGGDASETALRLFTAFGFIGTTVLAVDHINRTDADQQTRRSRPYGSVFKSNLARATFELRRTKLPDGSSALGVYNTKANDSDELPPVALRVVHADDGAITYERMESLPSDLTAPLKMADRIAAVLRSEGHMEYEAIAEVLDADAHTVRTTLNRNKQRFNKLPSGSWELLPEGRSHAS